MSPKNHPLADGEPINVLRTALAAVEHLALKYRQAIAILEGDGQPIAGPDARQLPARRLPGGGHLPLFAPNETMSSGAIKVLMAGEWKPLHIMEIVDRMIAAGFRNQNRKALRANITKTLERGKEFEKVAPATYRLALASEQNTMFSDGG